jgi:hypothetical protein
MRRARNKRRRAAYEITEAENGEQALAVQAGKIQIKPLRVLPEAVLASSTRRLMTSCAARWSSVSQRC